MCDFSVIGAVPLLGSSKLGLKRLSAIAEDRLDGSAAGQQPTARRAFRPPFTGVGHPLALDIH